MIDIKDEKARLRKDIRDLLRQVAPEQREEWSAVLTGRIFDLPEYRQAKTVMVFLSLSREFETTDLMTLAINAGKTVCAPKIDWATWTMRPVKLASARDVVTDEHRLNEPAGNEPVPVESIDLVLVPGLAFDVDGYRVGRGGGFYDRFLARVDLVALRVAPTFDLQVRPRIPHDSHDRRVDVILTPTKLLRIVR
jgi:5-formyltetrahydrofolate cyclo-ligase